MRVICFCGTYFESTDTEAECPMCGEPASLETDRDLMAMETELASLLARMEPQ